MWKTVCTSIYNYIEETKRPSDARINKHGQGSQLGKNSNLENQTMWGRSITTLNGNKHESSIKKNIILKETSRKKHSRKRGNVQPTKRKE